MDTMQQPKITGYRELSLSESSLMNEVKAHAEATNDLIRRVEDTLAGKSFPMDPVLNPARSLSIARSDLQTGYMWLVRAIAQPTTF